MDGTRYPPPPKGCRWAILRSTWHGDVVDAALVPAAARLVEHRGRLYLLGLFEPTAGPAQFHEIVAHSTHCLRPHLLPEEYR